MPHELDVVTFRKRVGRWPAGTRGTVVHAFDASGLVEIVDERGGTRDLVAVPYLELNVVWSASREEHVV